MALPEFALVLADSTAYGWLEGSTFGGTELVHREAVAGAEQRSALVAAVVCGGSLIKKGLAGPCAVDVLMKDWVLQGGATAFAGEQELEVGVVPAASSVPGREYEGLKTARSGFGVEETNTTILAAVGNAYGAKARPLDFVRAEAARAMDAVVRATIQDLVARRVARQQPAITAEPRSAGAEQRSAQWLPVIICAGWNCGEKEVGCQAIAVQFNTAAAAEGHTGRLLPSRTAQRLWRFDTNPGSAAANYGGRRKRLTATQAASDSLEGRSRRAVLRRWGASRKERCEQSSAQPHQHGSRYPRRSAQWHQRGSRAALSGCNRAQKVSLAKKTLPCQLDAAALAWTACRAAGKHGWEVGEWAWRLEAWVGKGGQSKIV